MMKRHNSTSVVLAVAFAAMTVASAVALKSYLDKQVKEGKITPAERKALGR